MEANFVLPLFPTVLIVMSGKFIVFEGPDGSGKTLHSTLFAERLRKEGHDVLHTVEPTKGPIGKQIREFIAGDGGVSHEVMQLLFSADRGWHLEKEVQPALQAGKTVVSDRYYYSTFMYGEAAGLSSDWLRLLNAYYPRPDYIVLALPSMEVCSNRIGGRASQEVFEKRAFQERTYRLYEHMAREPGVIVIDTGGNKDEVAQEIWERVMERVGAPV